MNKQYYDNRELSWLKFNKRVLEEAMDKNVPLMERLTFISIFQSNLDEFFMVRVGALYDKLIVDPESKENKTNMKPKEEIKNIIKYTKELNLLKDKVYKDLVDEIKKYGINMINLYPKIKKDKFSSYIQDMYDRLISVEDEKILENIFEFEIRPLISPQIISKRQPFPFLKEKEIYAVVSLENKNGSEKLGIIPCSSDVFERLIHIPSNKNEYILSEELILYFIDKIFKKYNIKSKALIRITRNADIDEETIYDEDLDYREMMKKLITKRKKLAPIRMEMFGELNSSALKMLLKYIGLKEENIFYSKTPLEFSYVNKIQDKLRNNKELFYEKRIPQKLPTISSKKSIIRQIEEKDKLLFYPYNSMNIFLDMLYEASEDETVVSIKMTLYRLSSNSKIVEILSNAVENGKEVVVLVELRARFDEENNINWSRKLEKNGCRIIYGLPNLKVHSKICLITRKTDDGIKYITQIGTGNYNEKTANLYTDYSLMTANKRIAHDIGRVFNKLFLGEMIENTDLLLVSPLCLRNPILKMIDNEITKVKYGLKGFIGIKVNSLTDKVIIDKLIEASRYGVKVQLIVRGICCLIPNIKNETENIEVISIVGRYLEHTRVYIFGEGNDSKVYISSADFMTRNTIKRVEVATPILDSDIKNRIIEDFMIMYSDNVKARKLMSDGNYIHVKPQGALLNSQEYFFERAYKEMSESNL